MTHLNYIDQCLRAVMKVTMFKVNLGGAKHGKVNLLTEINLASSSVMPDDKGSIRPLALTQGFQVASKTEYIYTAMHHR